jgi:hypothetical protein
MLPARGFAGRCSIVDRMQAAFAEFPHRLSQLSLITLTF